MAPVDFPKSLDVGKAMDKMAGAEREVVGYDQSRARPNRTGCVMGEKEYDRSDNGATQTAPATDLARKWQGWGTALKPAHEPIVVARKPLVGTVAANVEAFGTGALNIDGCRIAGSWTTWRRKDGSINPSAGFADEYVNGLERPDNVRNPEHVAGRWPANVVLDEAAGAMLDEQSGALHSQDPRTRGRGSPRPDQGAGAYFGSRPMFEPQEQPFGYTDTGGASRFFYCPKADRSERETGLEGALVSRADQSAWVRQCNVVGGTGLEPVTSCMSSRQFIE